MVYVGISGRLWKTCLICTMLYTYCTVVESSIDFRLYNCGVKHRDINNFTTKTLGGWKMWKQGMIGVFPKF